MATQRHQEIADLANEMRTKQMSAEGLNPEAVAPYTAVDVARIMKAWQKNYEQRKAAGRTQPATHHAWGGRHAPRETRQQ